MACPVAADIKVKLYLSLYSLNKREIKCETHYYFIQIRVLVEVKNNIQHFLYTLKYPNVLSLS